ncbi:hypothetical protein DSO57_1037575 [Entomophthora muscae]|uniref:Uncharacterized protein n=1 Tax=Entomophthora muscae TaxID=34485 RepID=A0ACC2T9Y7_9FUNG|nr:hypothetical protein DSO57_1037575 [Entomophthora muscae]
MQAGSPQVFSLALFLLLLWSTSPDLWDQLLSSARLVGDNPSSLLHLPGSLLVSGETLIKILTCNDLDLYLADPALHSPVVAEVLTPPLSRTESGKSVPMQAPEFPTPVPSRAMWLLTCLVFMGLNAYFPQLSLMSSLWSPLITAVPVLHWVAYWWFVSPGWEPNLVSLAPLSHTYPVVTSFYSS